MYLLDTGIVAELRKARAGRTDPGLASWATGVTRQSLFVSAITLLELGTAAARLERTDKPAGALLRQWIDTQVVTAFDGRILPVDAAVVARRARLPYPDTRDGLLAATALEHGLTLVTRHGAAFKAGRVKLLNPWGHAPDTVDDAAEWGQVAKTAPLWLKNLFVRG